MWDKRLKIYDELVANSPRIERKGKTMPYTSANGYMFSLLNKAGEIEDTKYLLLLVLISEWVVKK